jgi:hypothetical protein
MRKTHAMSLDMKSHLGALAGLLLLATTVGCGTTVGLSSDRFKPQFDAAPLAAYRGKAVVLRGFENVDASTSFYLYPGAGRRYGGPVLTSYFWYCFKAAFTQAGVNVFDEGQGPAGAPVMDAKLVHVAEDGFTAEVTVMGAPGQAPLQKSYTIPGPPITDPQPAALENRAYAMMNALFVAVVSDPAFQGALLR